MQWGLIRGMRNMFAHTYAKMDKKSIWDVAINSVPSLLRFCDNIIEKSEQENNKSIKSKDRDAR